MRSTRFREQSGFTLIEMLVVIIVLGILALLIISQIAVSTEEAKVNTLKTDLAAMRNAVELYYHQHNNVYPGANKIDGTVAADAGDAATAFVQQLTQYTEADGTVAAVKSTTAKYGPYIKGGALPKNPFDENNTVLCDIAEDNITVKAASGTASWKFYVKTGVLLANDGGSTDGVAHATY